MFSITTRDGRKIPFLKIAIPAWIGFVVSMTLIGHAMYLGAFRPLSPDPAQGFVLAQTVNRSVRYVAQTDQWLQYGLWALVVVWGIATAVYYWRIGLFGRRG